jgi:hypothetical protein
MTLYRNVASLILAVMLLQSASGILAVTTPLALSFMGASALGVGLVAATFSTGFMLGAWFARGAPVALRQFTERSLQVFGTARVGSQKRCHHFSTYRGPRLCIFSILCYELGAGHRLVTFPRVDHHF